MPLNFKMLVLVMLVFISKASASVDSTKIDSLWKLVGVSLNETYDYASTISDLQELQGLLLAAKKYPDYIHCVVYEAYCNFELKNFTLLKSKLDMALQHADSLKIDPHQQNFYVDAHYLYGHYYFFTGNYSASFYYYETCIREIQEEGVRMSFQIEDAFNNLAVVYEKNGDYEQSIRYFKRSLPALKTNSEKALRYSGIAREYLLLEDLEQAKMNYDTALFYLNNAVNEDPEIVNRAAHYFYNNLGEFYHVSGKPRRAFYYLDKSLALNIDDGVVVSKNMKERAFAHLKNNEPEMAESCLKDALDIRTRIYGKKHPEVADILYMIGELKAGQNNFPEALRFYQKALVALSNTFQDSLVYTNNPQFSSVSSRPFLFKILVAKGTALIQTGQQQQALKIFETAAELLDLVRQKYLFLEASKFFWLKKARTLYTKATRLALDMKEYEKAWVFSQKGHAVLLWQAVNENDAKIKALIPDHLLAEERQLKIEIAALELELQKQDFSLVEQSALDNILFDYNKKHQKFLADLERDYPAYFDLKYQKQLVGVKDLQQSVPDKGSAVLEYFIGEDFVVVFIFTKDKFEVVEMPLYENFKEDINTLKHHISYPDFESSDGFYEYVAVASRLYDLLLEKPDSLLGENIRQLILIPDEELNSIPFGALLVDDVLPQDSTVRYDKLDYLIRHKAISYNYSSNFFVYLNGKKRRKKFSGVATFAPTFNGVPSETRNEAALKFNDREAQLVNEIMKGKSLTGNEATLGNFRKEVTANSIVHLATHAYCNDNMPLQSNIVFQDSQLFLYQIYDLPHQLELVVLSACETGTGLYRKGEGFISMARAFMQSGCPSIITTLWKVNDRKTPEFMADFYKHLKSGTSKNIALTNAKREYLDRKQFSFLMHPFYWSGFVHIGHTKPVAGSLFPVGGIICGFIFFTALLFLLFRYFKAKI